MAFSLHIFIFSRTFVHISLVTNSVSARLDRLMLVDLHNNLSSSASLWPFYRIILVDCRRTIRFTFVRSSATDLRRKLPTIFENQQHAISRLSLTDSFFFSRPIHSPLIYRLSRCCRYVLVIFPSRRRPFLFFFFFCFPKINNVPTVRSEYTK